MLGRTVKSLTLGLRRRWKAALTHAFGVIGALWTVTEITTKVSKTADQWVTDNGNSYTTFLLVAGLFRFLIYIYEVHSVSFLVPTTDSRITIKFDNLFEQKTDWIIGVNEFFDSSLGHVVSQNSLHGQFISKVFNGDEVRFRQTVDNALNTIQGTSTTRSIQPNIKYDIGTTAVINNGPYKAFLVAMSQTDIQTAKASSTVPLLWMALNGALRNVKDHGNGAALSLPLLGNGRSSINIEPQHLMRLIVLALIDYGRKESLPKQINIIAHEDCFEMLDIREIKRDWSVR